MQLVKNCIFRVLFKHLLTALYLTNQTRNTILNFFPLITQITIFFYNDIEGKNVFLLKEQKC